MLIIFCHYSVFIFHSYTVIFPLLFSSVFNRGVVWFVLVRVRSGHQVRSSG